MPKSKGRRNPKRLHTPPPVAKVEKVSPRWYSVLMFTLMGIGVLTIIFNYLGILPGGQRGLFLYSGLGAIAAGFVMTLNYH
ncbi:MAG TPA: cell division protein CrgA [Acidimicrobiia bacterium]|nr:cell division protein CrgA [Acidimicrobiia bacterium]